jgi:DNA-binding transcriptional regulator YiaG
MSEHAETTLPRVQSDARGGPTQHKIDVYDATAIVGLSTFVYDAAIERIDADGERTVELPKLPQLLASAALVRCLTPPRLRGAEIRAIRKILKLTLADLAKKLDSKAAPETISRWENEAQPMGAYVEKVMRLVVCEQLKEDAPGVTYSASALATLEITDPWRGDPDYKLPPIELVYGRVKEQSGKIVDAWDAKLAA